jgi:esterase/lipase superfamily enzyme
MHRQHHRWWSPSLHRHMDLLEFGHGGARVIAFPTSMGSFFEWEDQGMIRALRHHLENGWIHLTCVSSVDKESWYSDAHPYHRVRRHEQYDSYLLNEVLPFTWNRNPTPYLITAGASFGSYYAIDFGFRYPQWVNRIISMSGLCDIRKFCHGYHDEMVYYHNPIEFLNNEHEPWRLDALRRQDVILAVGKDDQLLHQNRQLSGTLWQKGIGNALREWDGFAHDWPWWHKMINMYIGGHD